LFTFWKKYVDNFRWRGFEKSWSCQVDVWVVTEHVSGDGFRGIKLWRTLTRFHKKHLHTHTRFHKNHTHIHTHTCIHTYTPLYTPLHTLSHTYAFTYARSHTRFHKNHVHTHFHKKPWIHTYFCVLVLNMRLHMHIRSQPIQSLTHKLCRFVFLRNSFFFIFSFFHELQSLDYLKHFFVQTLFYNLRNKNVF
jgi:hypothetical protein